MAQVDHLGNEFEFAIGMSRVMTDEQANRMMQRDHVERGCCNPHWARMVPEATNPDALTPVLGEPANPCPACRRPLLLHSVEQLGACNARL